MGLHEHPVSGQSAQAQPRAEGSLTLRVKARGRRSAIDALRSAGAMKVLFPRRGDAVEAIMINTSGGLTGGDRLDVAAGAGVDAHLCLTTQAAERAYRAADGHARVTSQLDVASNAQISWLPQELILFEGARLRRRLDCDLSGDARLLLVEPVVFGRVAMGETLQDVAFHDQIAINRDGKPLYHDAIRLDGDLRAQMARATTGQGAGAMASLVYVAPDAEAHLAPLRALMPKLGGASLLAPDLLVARLVATDSFELRRHLVPMLDRLSKDTLPTSWRL